MKKEPDYKIDPVSDATRSHFAAWILAISSLLGYDNDSFIFGP